MSESHRVTVRKLPTGVPGLDPVLGGGLPEFSFNLLAGAPGTGKTTLAQQIAFSMASEERPALSFSVLGESPLKMLRYQQQFSFFDVDKLDAVVRFLDLSADVLNQDLDVVLERIVREVEEAKPGIVVVDSFRTIVRASANIPPGKMGLADFVQRLALHLTAWQATTFLVGEQPQFRDLDQDNSVFTVADGILALTQSIDRNSVVRKLQVVKMRGQAQQPGLHTFRITDDGLQVFPRSFGLVEKDARPRPIRRISTGAAGLDEMMNGGIPAGDSVLIAGPAGSGKTALSTQFIAEGIRQGEPGVIAVFEEHPSEYVARAEAMDLKLQEMIDQGLLKIIYLRPLDLSVDETLHEVRESVEKLRARRVVVDSLSGFELALAPAFRDDFRESLYRMVLSLTGIGVTVLNTVEVVDAYNELRFSPHAISFLTDDIILLRYFETDGQLQKMMTVVKMRGGLHSTDLRAYEITSKGVVIGSRLRHYRGILSGSPESGLGDRSGQVEAGEDVSAGFDTQSRVSG